MAHHRWWIQSWGILHSLHWLFWGPSRSYCQCSGECSASLVEQVRHLLIVFSLWGSLIVSGKFLVVKVEHHSQFKNTSATPPSASSPHRGRLMRVCSGTFFGGHDRQCYYILEWPQCLYSFYMWTCFWRFAVGVYCLNGSNLACGCSIIGHLCNNH